MRVAERTSSLREMATSMLETRSSLQNNRLDEMMRKLTAWAAVIAVPTAVTGYFEQNVTRLSRGVHGRRTVRLPHSPDTPNGSSATGHRPVVA
jgi:hypothetical protein